LLIDFFRRAVRAEGTRALLTVMFGMVVVLVNILDMLIARRCRLQAGATGADKNCKEIIILLWSITW